jgi:hypothetical protein
MKILFTLIDQAQEPIGTILTVAVILFIAGAAILVLDSIRKHGGRNGG